MVRACHQDTCPTGIATQRPNLRAKFAGTPEGVAAYFLFVAEEVRRLLAVARAAVRSTRPSAGSSCLRQRVDRRRRGPTRSTSSPLLAPPDDRRARPDASSRAVDLQRPRSELGDRLLSRRLPGVLGRRRGRAELPDHQRRPHGRRRARRRHRARVRRRVPPRGTAHGRASTASAGQSFGAFLTHGIELELDRRGQRLRRQGHGRRAHRDPAARPTTPATAGHVLAGNTVPLRRDRRRAVRRRRGGRALRRAQLRAPPPWSRASATTAAST